MEQTGRDSSSSECYSAGADKVTIQKRGREAGMTRDCIIIGKAKTTTTDSY